jgi:hypothetical protein
MARETIDFHEYIVDGPESPGGTLVVKGTRIAGEESTISSGITLS